MITINQNVKMVLMLLGVVVFSGCTTKTIYVPQKCIIEKPIKSVFIYSCNAKFPDNDYLYGMCVAEKIELLNGDYEKLERAFDACNN